MPRRVDKRKNPYEKTVLEALTTVDAARGELAQCHLHHSSANERNNVKSHSIQNATQSKECRRLNHAGGTRMQRVSFFRVFVASTSAVSSSARLWSSSLIT